jgi:hypothetical protein
MTFNPIDTDTHALLPILYWKPRYQRNNGRGDAFVLTVAIPRAELSAFMEDRPFAPPDSTPASEANDLSSVVRLLSLVYVEMTRPTEDAANTIPGKE